MPEPIAVRVRDCAHPDDPHEGGDIVYLRPTLSLDGGIRATQDYQAVLSSGMSSDEMAAELTRRWLVTFVRTGVVSTNFLEPFDVQAILDDYSIAEPVSEKANDLYSEAVLRPLGLSAGTSSPRGRTNGSTSRTRRSTRKSPASP